MEDEFGAVDEGPLLEKTLDMAEEQRVEETGKFPSLSSLQEITNNSWATLYTALQPWPWKYSSI